MIWSTASRVIVDKVISMQIMTGFGPTFAEPDQPEVAHWRGALDKLINVMSLTASFCPLMSELILWFFWLHNFG